MFHVTLIEVVEWSHFPIFSYNSSYVLRNYLNRYDRDLKHICLKKIFLVCWTFFNLRSFILKVVKKGCHSGVLS